MRVIKNRSRKERLEIVMDIANKLKHYKTTKDTIIDLYTDETSFVPELKKIFNEYIKQDDELPLDFAGILRFEEINRDIEYVLPGTDKKEPLFVMRISKKGRR